MPYSKIQNSMTLMSETFGKQMQEMMDAEFGRGQVGFILILATKGEGGHMTIKTSLMPDSIGPLLKELAEKLVQGKETHRSGV